MMQIWVTYLFIHNVYNTKVYKFTYLTLKIYYKTTLADIYKLTNYAYIAAMTASQSKYC